MFAGGEVMKKTIKLQIPPEIGLNVPEHCFSKGSSRTPLKINRDLTTDELFIAWDDSMIEFKTDVVTFSFQWSELESFEIINRTIMKAPVSEFFLYGQDSSFPLFSTGAKNAGILETFIQRLIELEIPFKIE